MRPALSLPMLLLVAGGTAADGATLGRSLGFPEPRPFRMETIDGRSFSYNQESFLHRFSYRLLPPLESGLATSREGLYATAGSTRSDEFYTVLQLQKTVELDGPFHLRYRFMRDEDFDGRYDRNLLGAGFAFADNWSFTLYGDVTGAKERIDAQAELEWDDRTGNHLRISLVAPDFLFNSKQGEAGFTAKPFTAFFDLRRALSEKTVLFLYANRNFETRLLNETADLDWRYRQASGGVGISTLLRSRTRLTAWADIGNSRQFMDRFEDAQDTQPFLRRHREWTVDVERELRSGLSGWAGVKWLRLREEGRRDLEGESDGRLSRRELMLFAGATWRRSDRLLFQPGIYLTLTDNRDLTALAPPGTRRDSGFVGKVALPLTFTIHRESGATVTANPTLRLHRVAFGGGNVQLQVPF